MTLRDGCPTGYDRVYGSAIFSCERCGDKIEIKGASGKPPEFIASRARAKGWVVSPVRRADNLCPTCHKAPKPKNDPDVALRAIAANASSRPPHIQHASDISGLQEPPQTTAEPAQFIPETPLGQYAALAFDEIKSAHQRIKWPASGTAIFQATSMRGFVWGDAKAAIAEFCRRGLLRAEETESRNGKKCMHYHPTKELAAMSLPPLTPEQRLKIRSLLDKHFDDGIGRYLDGMSDEKVASSVNVPRIHVENMRETAYGPIKDSPEVLALRSELNALRQQMDGLDKKLSKLEISK